MLKRDGKRKGHSEKNRNAKGRAKSDSSVGAEKWLHEGANQYCKQSKSDSGINMTDTALVSSKGEEKSEVAESRQCEGEFEWSPEKVNDLGNHGHDFDHCATTTIQIINSITFNSSMSAAMGQGLKARDSASTAVPGQAYESEGLTSGDVKPHGDQRNRETSCTRRLPQVREGHHEERAAERGER